MAHLKLHFQYLFSSFDSSSRPRAAQFLPGALRDQGRRDQPGHTLRHHPVPFVVALLVERRESDEEATSSNRPPRPTGQKGQSEGFFTRSETLCVYERRASQGKKNLWKKKDFQDFAKYFAAEMLSGNVRGQGLSGRAGWVGRARRSKHFGGGCRGGQNGQ